MTNHKIQTVLFMGFDELVSWLHIYTIYFSSQLIYALGKFENNVKIEQ